MDGERHSVTGSDGIEVGLLTAGAGRALLLVHGGMGRLEGWAPMWSALSAHRRVTAMDRRGRGSSGDSESYCLEEEFEDIAAVATRLAEEEGRPVDVFAHSYGATCTLGAAARGAPFRRIALYEPPGPQTVPKEWVARATSLVSEGRTGRAMYSFVTEIVGLSAEQFEEYRAVPGSQDVLSIVAATLAREAEALTNVDLPTLAAGVSLPVLLLLGATSPPWAGIITRLLVETLRDAEVVVLPGNGHTAVDSAPGLVVSKLEEFFDRE